jgi:hypothetical protein
MDTNVVGEVVGGVFYHIARLITHILSKPYFRIFYINVPVEISSNISLAINNQLMLVLSKE